MSLPRNDFQRNFDPVQPRIDGAQPRIEGSTQRIERALSMSPDTGYRALHDELTQIRQMSMQNGRLDIAQYKATINQIDQQLHKDGFLPNLHIDVDNSGREFLVAEAGGGGGRSRQRSRHHSDGHNRRHHGRSVADNSDIDGSYADNGTRSRDGRRSERYATHGPNLYRGSDYNLSGGNNEQKIMNFFTAKGLTAAQAAGIVGNLVQESGANPARRQDGGGPGFGLAQWGGDRLKALQRYASAEGKPISDLGVQLNFMWKEMNTTERRSLAAVKSASSASEAARVFERTYERAGKPNYASRIRNADRVLAQFSPGNDNYGLA